MGKWAEHLGAQLHQCTGPLVLLCSFIFFFCKVRIKAGPLQVPTQQSCFAKFLALWPFFGHIQAIFRIYMQAIFRSYSNYRQAKFRPYLGYIQDICIFRQYSDNIKVIFQPYSADVQAIFTPYSGTYSGHLPVLFKIYSDKIHVRFKQDSGNI